MSDVPSDLKYTRDHEWARVEGDRVAVGITAHAAEQLGDIILVNVDAKVGARVEAGKVFGVVESTKSVSDLYAPITGTLVAINEALKDHPEKVNEAPYTEGWIIAVTPEGGLDELLDPAAYTALLGTL